MPSCFKAKNEPDSISNKQLNINPAKDSTISNPNKSVMSMVANLKPADKNSNQPERTLPENSSRKMISKISESKINFIKSAFEPAKLLNSGIKDNTRIIGPASQPVKIQSTTNHPVKQLEAIIESTPLLKPSTMFAKKEEPSYNTLESRKIETKNSVTKISTIAFNKDQKAPIEPNTKSIVSQLENRMKMISSDQGKNAAEEKMKTLIQNSDKISSKDLKRLICQDEDAAMNFKPVSDNKKKKIKPTFNA